MERLSDYLVFCDMDNTLLTAKEGIPACNRSVIRLFTAMGGRFTVASGRPPESIRAALGDIELSLPAISCNGSLLYDFQTNRVLRRSCLNQEQAAAAIADMLEETKSVIEKFNGVITANGGMIENVDEWGKRRLAYTIDYKTEGYYVLVVFDAPAELPAELERNMKNDEKIMRYKVTLHHA